MLPATFENILRADNIYAVIRFPRSPNARQTGNMKYDIDSGTSVDRRLPIAHVGPRQFNAERLQFRIVATHDCPHPIAARHQLLNDVPPKKATSAGDKCEHK